VQIRSRIKTSVRPSAQNSAARVYAAADECNFCQCATETRLITDIVCVVNQTSHFVVPVPPPAAAAGGVTVTVMLVKILRRRRCI